MSSNDAAATSAQTATPVADDGSDDILWGNDPTPAEREAGSDHYMATVAPYIAAHAPYCGNGAASILGDPSLGRY